MWLLSGRPLPLGSPWPVWLLLGGQVLAQVGYPLTAGTTRAGLVVGTVLLGYAASMTHALLTRGWRAAAWLLALTTGGGFAVEATGAATGFPFGEYDYSAALGPRLAGVPLVVPLAWTWMAWPAWLAALKLADRCTVRIGLGAVGLAAWDLFLDPQMVAEGYWRWVDPAAALPGVPGVPAVNYLGWLVVAVVMMTGLWLATFPTTEQSMAARMAGQSAAGHPAGGLTAGHPAARPLARADAPMYALYLWTYAASVLAHAVFLGLPASAAWGGLAMGVVAVPLAATLTATRCRLTRCRLTPCRLTRCRLTRCRLTRCRLNGRGDPVATPLRASDRGGPAR